MTKAAKHVPQPPIDRLGRSDGRRPLWLAAGVVLVGVFFIAVGLGMSYVVSYGDDRDPAYMPEYRLVHQVTTSLPVHHADPVGLLSPIPLEFRSTASQQTDPVQADDCPT
ncbi:MAG: hypothetical protein ACYS8X_05080 [Planctomycetota bacterium]